MSCFCLFLPSFQKKKKIGCVLLTFFDRPPLVTCSYYLDCFGVYFIILLDPVVRDLFLLTSALDRERKRSELAVRSWSRMWWFLCCSLRQKRRRRLDRLQQHLDELEGDRCYISRYLFRVKSARARENDMEASVREKRRWESRFFFKLFSLSLSLFFDCLLLLL